MMINFGYLNIFLHTCEYVYLLCTVIYIHVYIHTHVCVHVRTHTSIFFSNHIAVDINHGKCKPCLSKRTCCFNSLCTAPAIRGNLMLLPFLAVIIFSVRIFCDLFNSSKCAHIGHGIVFLKEPMGQCLTMTAKSQHWKC